MKSLLPCLGGFVAGVFVGAGLWLALILCATGLVAWWFGQQPDRPGSALKHIQNLGPRPRDKGR